MKQKQRSKFNLNNRGLANGRSAEQKRNSNFQSSDQGSNNLDSVSRGSFQSGDQSPQIRKIKESFSSHQKRKIKFMNEAKDTKIDENIEYEN